jgi:hypothetical protein
MRTLRRGLLACLAFGLAGCVGDGSEGNPWKLKNPFTAEAQLDPKDAPVANTKAATRADAIASAVIAANRSELPDGLVLMTVGFKEPMLFHQASAVWVSEGLVERCVTDAELAAAISHELGKIAAARPKKASRNEEDLPPTVPGPPDVVGAGHTADMTAAAEMALASRRTARGKGAREPKPDPRTIAQNLFTKAGYQAEDFKRVDSLVREAEDNAEKRDIIRGR